MICQQHREPPYEGGQSNQTAMPEHFDLAAGDFPGQSDDGPSDRGQSAGNYELSVSSTGSRRNLVGLPTGGQMRPAVGLGQASRDLSEDEEKRNA